MREPLYNKKFLKERGLVTNGYCLPYNPKLTARANELRENMTPSERKLWMEFFKTFPLNVMAQKVIDHYIVDFYCPKLSLVVEIDGSVHDSEEAQDYDRERTDLLEKYNLKVIRFKNKEIEEEFNKVCMMIMDEFHKRNHTH
ncbi:MAG: endonuclease domain-containing protein [Bacteroidota bacterium]